jgi:hypothetical protein
MRVPLLALALVSLAGSLPDAHSGAARARSPALTDLAFMAGCWRGASGGGATILEYYTPPSDNLILGMSRYVKGGKVTGYEFTTIAARGDSDLVLTPRPSGQSPADFNLTRLGRGEAVWSNPSHDFPQVIGYRSVGADSLAARIEGPGPAGPRSSEWRMGRVPCEG